jgi:hypothetical protein
MHSSIDKKTTREHVNFVSSLLLAYEELSHEKDNALHDSDAEESPAVEASKFDEDWIWRWRDHASQASHEYMRMIWAKILAGEIKNPNSFSLRTMSIVGGLSMFDAEKLSKIKDFIFVQDSIYWNNSVMDNITGLDGIKLDNLMWLEEVGIINGSTSTSVAKIFTSNSNDYFVNSYNIGNAKFFTFNTNFSLKIKIKICPLTVSGKEILRFLDIGVNDEYAKSISHEFTKLGCSVYKYIAKEESDTVFPHDLEHYVGPIWNFIENKPE